MIINRGRLQERHPSPLAFNARALKVYAHALTPTQPRKAEQTIREAIRLAEEGDDDPSACSPRRDGLTFRGPELDRR
jgi:hypothetical protein